MRKFNFIESEIIGDPKNVRCLLISHHDANPVGEFMDAFPELYKEAAADIFALVEYLLIEQDQGADEVIDEMAQQIYDESGHKISVEKLKNKVPRGFCDSNRDKKRGIRQIYYEDALKKVEQKLRYLLLGPRMVMRNKARMVAQNNGICGDIHTMAGWSPVLWEPTSTGFIVETPENVRDRTYQDAFTHAKEDGGEERFNCQMTTIKGDDEPIVKPFITDTVEWHLGESGYIYRRDNPYPLAHDHTAVELARLCMIFFIDIIKSNLCKPGTKVNLVDVDVDIDEVRKMSKALSSSILENLEIIDAMQDLKVCAQ